MNISDITGVECTLGSNVNVTNIGPVLNYQDGVKVNFSVSNNSRAEATFTLSLDITSISDNLLVESFQYKLVQDVNDGTNYDYDNPVAEGNFSTFEVGSNLIKEDLTVEANTTYTYQFIVYIDGTIYNDPNMQENSLNSNLVFGDCGNTNIHASNYIINLYNDGSILNTVNIAGDTSKPTVSLNATQGLMLDNNGEYRYYGTNPNNYVQFNNELWRIISVSNVKSSTTDTTGSMRVKIIRNESIGSYSWDSSDSSINSGLGVNDWTQADLMTELNVLYYNQQAGTCYNGANNASTDCVFTTTGLSIGTKAIIDDALWYLGGIENYTEIYPNDCYNFERGTLVYDCSTDDGACPRATTWTGKVALIYPSDYYYAVDLSVCTKNSNSFYEDTNCKENDWLFVNTSQPVLSPFSSDGRSVFSVVGNGKISSRSGSSSLIIKPTVILKSNIAIVSGEGTETNPYILG